MKSRAQELHAIVKERLIPHILASGFHPDERPIWKHDPYGHQFRRFLRRLGDRLELLEIQFDKHGRASFVLNFGVVPPTGVANFGKRYSPDETAIMHLPQKARLYAGSAWRMRWFGFPWLRVPFVRNPSGARIVEKAILLFPQIQLWLREGIVGPNVKVTNCR
jgi:hypothetical protein